MVSRRSLGVLSSTALFAALLPTVAAGQAASLLLDINSTAYGTEPQPTLYSQDLRVAGDKLFFMAGEAGKDPALWVSDGTSAGTEILRNFSSPPSLVGGLGKLMLWIALGSNRHGHQLWRSDGTRPGTFALTEPGMDVGAFAFFRRSLYFVGCSGGGAAFDCDLWRTDGSVAGTQVFHEAPRLFYWLHVAGERLYYIELQDGSDNGIANLWVTDGTAAGTAGLGRLLFPLAPASAGGRLFFLAFQDGGLKAWTSDGTVAGTRAVTPFPITSSFPIALVFKAVGGRVYFVADDGFHGFEIWRTDGTDAGTLRLTDLADDNPFPSNDPSILAVVGDTVVFVATDGEGPARLWTARGKPESTSPLALSCADCRLIPYPGPAAAENRAYFWLEKGLGPELWGTDGTVFGTQRVKRFCETCHPALLHPVPGGFLFAMGAPGARQIWFSTGTADRTAAFTQLAGAEPIDSPQLEIAVLGEALYLLARGEAGGLWVQHFRETTTRQVLALPRTWPSSDPGQLTALGSRLLFTAWDGFHSFGLWSSSGTPGSTAQVSLPEVSWRDADLVPAAGLLFGLAEVPFFKLDLWRTDGTPAGTFKLASVSGEAAMVPFNGALYFFDKGKIWRSNGTVEGTVESGNLPAALITVLSAAPGPNGIYLKTVNNPFRTEFWITDGTSAGTRQLTNSTLSAVDGVDPEFTTVGSHVYFKWNGLLWKTDGTQPGTTALAGLPANEAPSKLLSHQGALYFFTRGVSAEYDLRLWRTDGTPAGTVELGRFPEDPELFSTFSPQLVAFGGRLVFPANDGVHGVELWATDGTVAGTSLVHDLLPGPGSSNPTHLIAAGGRLLFSAGDDYHGSELWESDGTPTGTRMVQDIFPQAASSAPDQLTVVGDKLFFTADDGVVGRELWVLPLSGSTACQPSSTKLCLSGGRYAVEAAWRDFQGRQGVGHAQPLTADTGYFWFFDPANVETVLKVLDGRGVNGHVWVFYGALSTVEYALTVTDTETGLTHRYVNPPGQLASVGDTRAFGPLGATTEALTTSVAPQAPLTLVSRRVVPSAKATSCVPSSTRLCLNGGRFAAEIAWKDFQGNSGAGQAVELTGDTGWFWFFNASNVEVVLKVLDGTPVNGHHWVFYGALSSVEYTVTVTDTATGEVATYRNASGRLASVADTRAF